MMKVNNLIQKFNLNQPKTQFQANSLLKTLSKIPYLKTNYRKFKNIVRYAST
jgi:hypothetical protein